MATYTTNYNLGKPEATDPFGDFRQSYNDNMDIIDANLGGGGGGGGHTIVDENGSDMPAESKLQFTGNVSVTDDNVNGATVVDVLGGGGNVYGAFIDPNRILASGTYSNSNPLIYTATEDCFADVAFLSADGDKNVYGYIDGVQIDRLFNNSGIVVSNEIYPLRKGQTLRVETSRINSDSAYTIYGVTQGTNGIFAPVIYSDNERKIGIWRDNKPLYQRILTLTQDTTLVADSWVKTEFNKDTMETLVRVDASIGTSGAVVEALSGGFIDGKLALNSARNVGLNVSDNARIIVQYTKTTDVAGSGNWNTDGVPTEHYDASEQVVGTWFGKPLYQKTIVKNNVDMGNNGGNLTSIPHGVSDLKECVKLEMACPKLNYITTSDITSSGGSVIATFRVDTANVFCSGGNNYFGGTADRYWYITIRYTKTTD